MTYGHRRTLTFHRPRDQYDNFRVYWRYFVIRKKSASGLTSTLHTKDLTQEQVWEMFNDIYGE